jgi:hypothetical protein
MKPEMFFGEAPKTCNFPKSCRVQGAMVEVVEFKSNTLVFKLFSSHQMWRRNLSSIFSFIFRYRLRYNQFISCEIAYVTVGTYLSYKTSFKSGFELAVGRSSDQ